MAATANTLSGTGLLNLERELVCFICTETLYQPLTLLDCLHTFCGSCLKEWFSHQHRKATSSHSSSSTANPYTCPTCRATVKDAQHNAMVNTLLDMFLNANPTRHRSDQEREELAKIYKPGDNILPKVEGRRRERRTRRDGDTVEARERRMVEEARERSLRDVGGSTSTNPESLRLPAPPRQSQASRSREREERRERRREQERQDRRQRAPERIDDADRQRRESLTEMAPASSPRHPAAVEARQRQQTVVHQASLASLISSSESSTGSSTNDNLSEIMQEILAEGLGLLDGVDVDALTESEQDALAERIAEAYRQRRRERNQRNHPSAETPPAEHAPATSTSEVVSSPSSSSNLQVDDNRRHQRSESASRQRRADTMPSLARDDLTNPQPRPVRAQPMDSASSLPPPSSVVTHRRRTSSQGQYNENSRDSSRRPSPAARSSASRNQSATDVTTRSQSQDQIASGRALRSVANQRPSLETRNSPRTFDNSVQGGLDIPQSHRSNQSSTESFNNDATQSNYVLRQRPAESASTETAQSRPVASITQSTGRVSRHTSGPHEEPSIACYRCHRADVQYEVYRHCDKCDLDLCHRCYRSRRGCKHWYGFGHAAMAQFEIMHPAAHEPVELPHALLIGRQYKRPPQSTIVKSKLAKDGTTIIPLQTTSDPASRFQEGRFCDRCSAFANSCFWSCDYCNYGEWGFCQGCVNTHHCCTHPLLPSAHKSFAPMSQTTPQLDPNVNPTASELHAATLRPSPTPSQPSSATSASSALAGPLPDYINLVFTTHCDICSQPIAPSSHRFHCPAHSSSSSSSDPDTHGNYDICTPCYHNLVKVNRIKREDGPAGWRKCPLDHRMIITTFVADNEGGQRRVVVNDLVGGWKTPEEAMNDWNAELEARRDQTGNTEGGHHHNHHHHHPSSPDSITARRLTRARTSSWSANDPVSPISLAFPFNSASRFPPDGGTGLRGVAWYSYFPDDSEKGPNDLVFPIGAEIREIRINEEYPDWCGGVYAGDRGLLPASYLRI